MGSRAAPVLVIEDNADSREGWAVALQREGFLVITASDGGEALALLRDGLRPCIILLDLMMPVTNGFEFREQQLRDPELADIPVIVCSGVTDPNETASHLGAKALVHKPVAPDRLIALVRQHCLKPGEPPPQ